jgi:hypothetical protein
MIGDNIPDHPIVYHVITVDKDIAKGDNPLVIGDPCDQIGIFFGQSVQRLTDDLELPFDSGP